MKMSGTAIEVGFRSPKLADSPNVCVNPYWTIGTMELKSCFNFAARQRNLCKPVGDLRLNAPGGGFSEEIVVKAINCSPFQMAVSLKLGATRGASVGRLA